MMIESNNVLVWQYIVCLSVCVCVCLCQESIEFTIYLDLCSLFLQNFFFPIVEKKDRRRKAKKQTESMYVFVCKQ